MNPMKPFWSGEQILLACMVIGLILFYGYVLWRLN